MKSRNLFLGIVILFIGVVSLLASVGVIDVSWRLLWRLWPMSLILIGIAILPVKDWMKALLLVAALAIGVLLYRGEAEKEAKRASSGWVHSFRNWKKWFDADFFDFD